MENKKGTKSNAREAGIAMARGAYFYIRGLLLATLLLLYGL